MMNYGIMKCTDNELIIMAEDDNDELWYYEVN